MEKISRLSFRDAQRFERIADLCWQLCHMLSAHYVGYEQDVSRLTSLAIEFEEQFDKICPRIDEG